MSILKKIDSQMAVALISEILNTPAQIKFTSKQLKMGNCNHVYLKAIKYGKKSSNFSLDDAIDELDKKNVIIFCKPKTQIH